MTRYSLLIPLFALLIFTNTNAQTKQITHQELFWMRYYNQLSLNDKWTLHSEFDERRFLENNRHQQFIIHERIHYKFAKNSDVGAGITYSLQSPQFPNGTSNLVIPEIRGVQEFNYTNYLTKRLWLQQRLRVDERFIHHNNGDSLLSGYGFNFRFRYRLQLTYNISKEGAQNLTILKLSNELMVNAGKEIVFNPFDQNRVSFSIEQGLTKNFGVELGYIYWYQQRPTGYKYFERDIFRFTLYHKLKL